MIGRRSAQISSSSSSGKAEVSVFNQKPTTSWLRFRMKFVSCEKVVCFMLLTMIADPNQLAAIELNIDGQWSDE